MSATTPEQETLQRQRGQQVAAKFRTYTHAQRAVDFLSDDGFDVSTVSIVGTDLHFVERVTGRRGYVKAAGGGALTGAFIGLLLGWLLGLFNIVDPLVASLWLGFWGLVLGAAIGAIMGVAGHAMTGGKRDFESVNSIQAMDYWLLVDEGHYEDARERLERLSRP